MGVGMKQHALTLIDDTDFAIDDDAITERFRPQDGARVLVADDDPAMRAMLREALLAEGYEVHEAASGRELLAALSELSANDGSAKPIDLIITDVRMPGMTGLEALRIVARDRFHVSAVLMTAFPDSEVMNNAEQLGVPLLCKPFALADISRAALRALLDGAQPRVR